MAKTFVVNTTERNLVVGKSVKGTVPESDVLYPGANTVDAESWKAAKVNPLVKLAIEEGRIQELEPPKDDKQVAPDGSVTTTKALEAKEALLLVKNTPDLNLLKKWRETEDRANVQKAIDDQVKAIEKLVERGNK